MTEPATIPGIILAMPLGSKWRVMNHRHGIDIGHVTVLAHRRSGMELYVEANEQIMTLKYPANDSWAMQEDHVRIGDVNGNIIATYAPA